MGQPLPEKLLFAWPMPDVVGLELDPRKKATVRRGAPGSPAERAAFQRGDEILTFSGQAVLSIADVQWVLTNADEATALKAEVLRAGEAHTLTLDLEKGWRRKSDIAWRPSTWYMRLVLAGELALEELSADERREVGIGSGELALRHHRILSNRAAAYRAGFRPGDILVSFDGSTERRSEAELLAYTLENKAPGDEVPVTVLRAVGRHLQRLQLVLGRIAGGEAEEQAIGALRPRLFFKTAQAFRRQLKLWNPARLGEAIARLTQAEIDCKTTGLPDRALCGRALMEIAQRAAPQGLDHNA